ncbi:MAG: type I methionyl aminopeptidase [Christensenellaceae bacterium]|jgi:methionyl aminopeptidase|nr:type I methionyl aminopeptidase [Christensenellaceae bacterium]
MITLKSKVEIDKMRESCRVAAHVMDVVLAAAGEGVTTKELDRIAYEEILKFKGIPSFLNYEGFPASICSCVNDEIVHGIPGKRKLKSGDILTVDLGVILHGYHSDMARTVGIGVISPDAQKLIDVTKECFFRGIEKAVPGNRIVDISREIQTYAEANGMSVVRPFVGHGIGQEMHEDPEVPNYVTRNRGPVLRAGMTIAVEPMINLGSKEVSFDDDGWTARTKDGKYSAQYENTIVITDGLPEILTLPGFKWEDRK